MERPQNPRRGRPPLYSPEEAKLRDRASKSASARRLGQKRNEERREKRWRWKNRKSAAKQRRQINRDGMSIVTDEQLRSPQLNWLDTNGKLHREQNLSADELIARFLAREKKRQET